jgi:hypothetical protein
LLTRQEISSDTFGGLFIVLNTMAVFQKFKGYLRVESQRLSTILGRTHATTEIHQVVVRLATGHFKRNMHDPNF